MARQPVLLAWQAAATFGWGVVGLNLFHHWAQSSTVHPLMAFPIGDLQLSLQDTGKIQRICTSIIDSNRFSDMLATTARPVRLDMPVVHALGNAFEGDLGITGRTNFGRVVFQDTRVAPYRDKLDRLDALICISEWNAELLRACSDKPVHVTHEAVDHDLFFPAPRVGLLSPDRFHIFTGGKIEFLKGHDLTLLAFREFSRRHKDAVLVTAWHSPWPAISEGFQGRLDAPLHLTREGRVDVMRWVADNGVDPRQVVDLGTVPNAVTPRFLREMDCALAPSRGEGGTNMVAMEAMACGVPAILAANSGLVDLIAGDNCIPLSRQGPVVALTDWGTDGWGESDVEEIVESLERLYTSAELRRRIGAAGAAFMQTRTWPAHAEALERVILPDLEGRT